MNFLAHALLSGEAEADRVGGLMGDFVKGPLPAGLPPDLAAGVALHRAIDSFADRHPAFAASRARVRPGGRRGPWTPGCRAPSLRPGCRARRARCGGWS